MLENRIAIEMVIDEETGEERFIILGTLPGNNPPGYLWNDIELNEKDFKAALLKAGISQEEIDAAIIAVRSKFYAEKRLPKAP